MLMFYVDNVDPVKLALRYNMYVLVFSTLFSYINLYSSLIFKFLLNKTGVKDTKNFKI